MDRDASKAILRSRILAVRRKLLLHNVLRSGIRTLSAILPTAALIVAADQYLAGGQWTLWTVSVSVAVVAIAVAVSAWRHIQSPLASAHVLDEKALLKDRIASAWEFLSEPGELDEPRRLQVLDALQHAQQTDLGSLFHFSAPRATYLVPVFIALFVGSFFVKMRPVTDADAAVNLQKEQQLSELQALRDELEESGIEEKELEDVLRKLEDIEKRFNEGKASERDVLIELARMDEQLKAQMAQLGVEQLASELGTIMPHLMASDASRAAAQALKQDQFDKAAEEMKKLADKMDKGELSKKDKEDLARNFGVAASKLNKNGQNSFSSDFSGASQGLKESDAKKFGQSTKSMGDKFQRLGKRNTMNRMRNSITMCKAGLGQPKVCKECNGEGCKACEGTGLCNKMGNKPGGLKAGVGTANPFGDPTRLSDSFKNMLHVAGMQGEGPVESEVETTEGQGGESGLEAKDLYEEYAAIAEQAIEREEVPLSHRYHVKRYFQSIRPTE